MANVKTMYVCTECGTSHPKWVGRCTGCEDWNTLVEESAASAGSAASRCPASTRPGPARLCDIDVDRAARPGLSRLREISRRRHQFAIFDRRIARFDTATAPFVRAYSKHGAIGPRSAAEHP